MKSMEHPKSLEYNKFRAKFSQNYNLDRNE